MKYDESSLACPAKADADTSAQKVNENQQRYGNSDDCSWFGAANHVYQVTEEIDYEHQHGEPVTPPTSLPQPDDCEETGNTNNDHQYDGPGAKMTKRFVSPWIESPDGFEKTVGEKQ